MSEVKRLRYDFRSDYDVNSDGVVQTSAVYASDDGDYVLFTDHDALLADQLQAHQCAEQMLKDDIAARDRRIAELEAELAGTRDSLAWANQFAMDVRTKLCEHSGQGWERRCLDKIRAHNTDTMYE